MWNRWKGRAEEYFHLMPELLDMDSFPSIHISLANMIMLCTVVLLPDIPIYEINISLDRKNNLPSSKL